jgi:hypothetical protein
MTDRTNAAERQSLLLRIIPNRNNNFAPISEFDTTFPVVGKYLSIPKLSVQLLRGLAASRLFFPLMSSRTPVKSIESQGVLKNKALPELKMKLLIEPFKEESTDSSSDSDETSETENDGFTSDGPQKQGPKLECQIREYEEKYNFKGEAVLKLVEENVAVDAKEEGKEYAMTSYKHYDRDGSLALERVEIHSPHVKEALRVVIKEYPGVSFNGQSIILHGKLRCIFHYSDELEKYTKSIEPVAKAHVDLLLRFMGKELRNSIRGYKANVETSIGSPSIEFSDLWMIFLPGELVITGQYEACQILKLVSTTTVALNGGGYLWRITGRCFTHDGTHFGYSNKQVDIYPYEGTKLIRKLTVLPLRYYGDENVLEPIRKSHVERGKKFCAFRGNHYRSYDGIADAVGDELEKDSCAADWSPWKYRLETVTVSITIITYWNCTNSLV